MVDPLVRLSYLFYTDKKRYTKKIHDLNMSLGEKFLTKLFEKNQGYTQDMFLTFLKQMWVMTRTIPGVSPKRPRQPDLKKVIKIF